MLAVPLRVLPGIYKHLEPEYQAFVGLYIINISVQTNTNLRWSATIIKSICYNLQNEHPVGSRKFSEIFSENTSFKDVKNEFLALYIKN